MVKHFVVVWLKGEQLNNLNAAINLITCSELNIMRMALWGLVVSPKSKREQVAAVCCFGQAGMMCHEAIGRASHSGHWMPRGNGVNQDSIFIRYASNHLAIDWKLNIVARQLAPFIIIGIIFGIHLECIIDAVVISAIDCKYLLCVQ